MVKHLPSKDIRKGGRERGQEGGQGKRSGGEGKERGVEGRGGDGKGRGTKAERAHLR